MTAQGWGQKPWGPPTGGPPDGLAPGYAPPQTTSPIGRRWLVLLLAGVATLVAAGVLGGLAVSRALGGPVLAGAGSLDEHVHRGTYLLYAQIGTTHSVAGFSFSQTSPAAVDVAAVHATVGGSPVEVTPWARSYSETLQRGSADFLAVGEVHVPAAGELTLTADDDEGRLLVAPSFGSTANSLVVPAVLGLVGLASVVVAIVWRVRAGSKRKPRWVGYGAWPPPGAWPGQAGPPPSGPGTSGS